MNVYSPVGCGIPDRAQNMVHMMNKSNICGLLDCAVWWASPRGKKNPTLVYGPNALREMAQNFYLDSENLLARWSPETHEDIDACVLVKDLSF